MESRRLSGFAIISFLFLILISSCSPSGPNLEDTVDLTITTRSSNVSTMSILPEEDAITPENLSIELENKETKEVSQAGSFPYNKEGGEYTLSNVKIGSYKIIVKGKITRNGEQVTILTGSTDYNVTASGKNSCTVEMKFGSDGKGLFEANIIWKDLTATSGSPLADAISKNKSLGFLAFYEDTDEPISGENGTKDELPIQWVDDIASGEYLYHDYEVPATGKTSKDIYFLIYTKDSSGNISVVAKTFYTSLTIYPNVLSIPDTNEAYNFVLTNNNVQGYLQNVSDVKVTIDDKDPSGTLVVSWTNPAFSSSVYPMTVSVRIEQEGEGSYTHTETVTFSSVADSKERTVKFTGLSAANTYSIYTKIDGAVGYSLEDLQKTGVRTQGVTKIEFGSALESTYVVGDSIDIKAKITPAAADQNKYTIKEQSNSDGITIEGHNVTFAKYGDYTIVLVADEDNTKTASQTVTVKLASPADVKAENSDGVKISWKAVSGATGYTVYRSGSDDPIVTGLTATSYIDKNVEAGGSYSYTVVATVDNTKYNSDKSEVSNTVTTAGAFFEIKIPSIPSLSLTSYLEPVRGRYLKLDDEAMSSIGLELSNPIEGATRYIWKLNDTELVNSESFETAKTLSITTKTEGILTDSVGNNPNTLRLEVYTANAEYSGSVQFYVIRGEIQKLSSISDENNDGYVRFGESEKLIPSFSGNGVTPGIIWSSSDNEVMTVDDHGNVTAVDTGTAIITATVSGTDNFCTKEIIVYNYATELSVSSPSHALIVEKDGVDVVNNYSSLTIAAVPVGIDSAVSTTSCVSWVITSGNDLIDIKDNGNNTVTISSRNSASGIATIAAEIDGIQKAVSINIIDFSIYNGQDNNITGKNHSMSGGLGGGNDYSLSLVISPDNYNSISSLSALGFSIEWCLNGKSGNTKEGAWGSTRNLLDDIDGLSAILYRSANAVQQAPDVDITVLVSSADNTVATVKFRAVDA